MAYSRERLLRGSVGLVLGSRQSCSLGHTDEVGPILICKHELLFWIGASTHGGERANSAGVAGALYRGKRRPDASRAAQMALLRLLRQGLVQREGDPVGGYVYRLTDAGSRRMLYLDRTGCRSTDCSICGQ